MQADRPARVLGLPRLEGGGGVLTSAAGTGTQEMFCAGIGHPGLQVWEPPVVTMVTRRRTLGAMSSRQTAPFPPFPDGSDLKETASRNSVEAQEIFQVSRRSPSSVDKPER